VNARKFTNETESRRKRDLKMRKQKGFSLIELLIVVAIILIIAAIAIPNLMRARIAANESAGASTVRTLNTSEVTYSTTYAASGYAKDLQTLGPNGVDCSVPGNVTATSACLIDSVLGCGVGPCPKGAYNYKITATAATPVPDYFITATSLGQALAKKDYCSITDAVVRFQVTAATPAAVASATACAALPAIQ
jgi:prepilin-type N-terminal cleavage/methylation domain-containing protein